MERETFISGYCRNIDNSRMVALECEDDVLTAVDCDFETCPHTKNCTIAQNIKDFLPTP